MRHEPTLIAQTPIARRIVHLCILCDLVEVCNHVCRAQVQAVALAQQAILNLA